MGELNSVIEWLVLARNEKCLPGEEAAFDKAIEILKAREPHYPICERCGKPINHIKTSVFQYDGTDSEYQMPITFDEETGCVVFETTQNWTGYELDDEERKEGIRCPNCGEYPFDSNVEIEFHEPVEVLMWASIKTDQQHLDTTSTSMG